VLQERADDDVMETQLFVRRVTVDSFRRYTLVAENAVGARTHQVRFIRSKSRTRSLTAWRIEQCFNTVKYSVGLFLIASLEIEKLRYRVIAKHWFNSVW